jgi:hypothetical protein
MMSKEARVKRRIGITEFIEGVRIEELIDSCRVFHGCQILVEVQLVTESFEVSNHNNMKAL